MSYVSIFLSLLMYLVVCLFEDKMDAWWSVCHMVCVCVLGVYVAFVLSLSVLKKEEV